MRIRTCLLGTPLTFVLAIGCSEAPPAAAAPKTDTVAVDTSPTKKGAKSAKRKPKIIQNAGPSGVAP